MSATMVLTVRVARMMVVVKCCGDLYRRSDLLVLLDVWYDRNDDVGGNDDD